MRSHFLGRLPSDYISLAALPRAPARAAWGGACSRRWLLELPQEQLSAARQKGWAPRPFQGRDKGSGLCTPVTSELVIGQAGAREIQAMSATLLSMAFLPAEYPRLWVSLNLRSRPWAVVKCSKPSLVTFQGHDLAYFIVLLGLSCLFCKVEMVFSCIMEG